MKYVSTFGTMDIHFDLLKEKKRMEFLGNSVLVA